MGTRSMPLETRMISGTEVVKAVARRPDRKDIHRLHD